MTTAHLGDFAASPSPSLDASAYEDGDNGANDDEDEDTSSSGDEEMIASQ